VAGWQDHRLTYIYYFDDTPRAYEVQADRDAELVSSLPLPLDFEAPIRLEGFEISNSKVKPGGTIILLLYWRAMGRIGKDYTVFVHLVGEDGQMIEGYDGAPRDGKERTSRWFASQFTPDARVLTIPASVQAGSSLQIELGLYDASTLERLMIVDGNGSADGLLLEALRVE
jgi:hypothetical protein